MTTDPDAPATLRQIAATLSEAFRMAGAQSSIRFGLQEAENMLNEIATAPAVAKAPHRDKPRIEFLAGEHCVSIDNLDEWPQEHADTLLLALEKLEIATAPVVATKSDQPATPAHLVPEGGLSAVIGPTRAGGPDHIGQAGERPATPSSPADPFAGMVEAAAAVNKPDLILQMADHIRSSGHSEAADAIEEMVAESAGMREALLHISNSHLGDCPAAFDELAHAKTHIGRLRKLALDALNASERAAKAAS